MAAIDANLANSPAIPAGKPSATLRAIGRLLVYAGLIVMPWAIVFGAIREAVRLLP